VVPQFAQEMFAETRRQGNAVRRFGWLATHPTAATSSVVFPRGGGAATVGIVAENAAKPTADQTYSQVTVNIFVWAGISKLSNQLVADGDPLVADLTARELGSLLGNLEEQKIIAGSGTGEPRGIVNTTGVVTDAYTDATPTTQELVDKIIDSISSFQTAYFMPPNGILMHPRRLAFLQKGKDSSLNYLFNPAGTFRAPGGLGGTIGANSVSTGEVAAMPTLLGLPIGVSTNIPTTFSGGAPGAGTEDVIIIGDWNEAHWFQRQDVTLDASNQTSDAFEKNQTWFRLEERAGFSAERYPTAFRLVAGTGLVP
jgi:HK97 family phage major capsid protein